MDCSSMQWAADILISPREETVPVMKDDACEERNSTAEAMSSGQALRPRGCLTAVEASIADRLMSFSFASVSAHCYASGQASSNWCQCVSSAVQLVLDEQRPVMLKGV